MDSIKRRMNPVAMTINPCREYLPSHGLNQQPPVLKSSMLATEPWGSATSVKTRISDQRGMNATAEKNVFSSFLNLTRHGKNGDKQYFFHF